MKTRKDRPTCGRSGTGAHSLQNFLLVSAVVALIVSQQLAQAKETATKTIVAAAAGAPTTTRQDVKEAKVRQDSQALDRKQGDQIDSLFNTDEYVQIKPEEIGAGEPSKELDAATLDTVPLAELPSGSASEAAAKTAAAPAEHKSVDDELNAHLAQDSISTMESANRVYAAGPAPMAADPRAARAQYAPARAGHMSARRPHNQARPPMGAHGGPPRAHRQPPGYGMPPRPAMHPSAGGYLSLKGKLADGISSMVPQVSRPYGPGPMQAPAHPSTYGNGPPRYLPRGAAAGYAAFREFVRAQANRYKQQGGLGSPEPLAYNAAPPSGPSYGASAGQPQMPPPAAAEYRQPKGPGSNSYGPGPQAPAAAAAAAYAQPTKPEGAYSGPEPQPAGYGAEQAGRLTPKAKVTVAQAYIPHLAPAQGAGVGAYAGPAPGQNGEQAAHTTNPILSKLYGGRAPEGLGRPVYSKDYGMVIHYPQATVYTEPMSLAQLHKLAGSSITQVLEHLQHNIASGQRDESNTIQANKKHHLGHGLTIQAKEYLAPGKSGHYVPTTAAVISAAANKGTGYAGADDSALASYGNAPGSVSGSYGQAPGAGAPGPLAEPAHAEGSASGLKPELGSGYDRVKAAVAASSTRYNQPPKPIEFYNQAPVAGQPAGPAAAQSGASYANGPAPAPAPGPAQPSAGGKYEPLGHIATIIGSELESLYNKANSMLSKQIDPEIHAHVQAHLRSLSKSMGPVKMSEHDHRAPLVLSPVLGGQQRAPRLPYGPALSLGPSGYPRPPTAAHQPRARSPRRPHQGAPQQARPGGRYALQPHAASQHNQSRARPQQSLSYKQQQMQQQQQQQQQAYNSAEQQQLAQIMREFQLADDQYTPKNHPVQASNQGYPSKLMQKQQAHYQKQQQQYQASSPMPYDHSEGIELPQGPNDQIGEISELMEALKGTLEAHKNEGAAAAGYSQPPVKEHGKIEDVRYLASALGQVPSYAIQVPVSQSQQSAHSSSAETAVYEAAKKSEQQQPPPQQQQHYGSEQQPSYGQQQQQQQLQQYGSQSGYQQPAQNSGYQAAGAPQEQTNQQQYQAVSQPEQHYQQQQQQQQQQAYQSSPQVANYGLGQPEQTAYQSHEAAAYGQQQQQPQYQQSAGYGQQAAQGPAQAYSVSSHQLEINHIAPTGQASGAYAAPAAAPIAQQADPYAQQQASGHDYQQPAGEQPASAVGPLGPAVHQHAQQQAYQQQPASVVDQASAQQAYSNVESAQIINHLVPVGQHQQQAAPAVGSHNYQQSSGAQHGQQLAAVTSDVTHQPVNQIGVAEPTDSQYQSGQPLSSFVDSLPSDYQELLRQPAGHSSILEGAASTQHESSGAPEPAGTKSGASSAQTSSASSSSAGSSSQRHQAADQHTAASSISSSYQQPLSAKATAYHSSSSPSSPASSSPSSKASAASSATGSSPLTSEQASDSQAASSASKSSAAAAAAASRS